MHDTNVVRWTNIKKVDATCNGLLSRLFPDETPRSLSNVFDQLCTIYGGATTSDERNAVVKMICCLRYRSLLPYIRDHLLDPSVTNNLEMAHLYVIPFAYVQHPDSLWYHSYIDSHLPLDSPLRSGRTPVWRTSLPLYQRNDAFTFYAAIVTNPAHYTFAKWYDAVEKLPTFTNQMAVSSLHYALSVVKDPAQIWPYMRPSAYIESVENMLNQQTGYIKGNVNVPPLATLALDE